MTVHVKGHKENEENWKKIWDIKTGNGIIMQMVKNQLRHVPKARTTKSKQRQHDLI